MLLKAIGHRVEIWVDGELSESEEVDDPLAFAEAFPAPLSLPRRGMICRFFTGAWWVILATTLCATWSRAYRLGRRLTDWVRRIFC